MSNLGQRTPTEVLVHRLRLMADAGGSLSRDRKRTCIEAADRLTELHEMFRGTVEQFTPNNINADIVRAIGGDADEKY